MIELINIGERNVECLIDGEGENTVIIIPGMCCSIYSWMNVINDICKYAKVIVIHRPGVGNTDEHKDGSTTLTSCEDLLAIIKKLNINEKIILVGHSYGGLCVQNFARLHPEIIKGIVLVDSSSVNAYKFNELYLPISNKTGSEESYIKKWTDYSQYTKEKLKAVVNPVLGILELKLPRDIQEKIIEFYISPSLYKSALSEIIDLRGSGKINNNIGEFPNIPLIILVRDYEYSLLKSIRKGGIPKEEAEKIEGLWQELSNELKALSNKSKIIEVIGSSHAIHQDRQDVVVDSIREFIQ